MCWSSRPAAGGHARAAASRPAPRRPADGMIRFVVGPDDKLVPDLAARLPGRGMWVSADRECLAQALARKQFARPPEHRWASPPIWSSRSRPCCCGAAWTWSGLARRAGDWSPASTRWPTRCGTARCALVLTRARRCRRRPPADRGAGREVPVLDPFAVASWAAPSAATRSSMSASPTGGLAEPAAQGAGPAARLSRVRMPAGHAAVSNAENKGTVRT